MANSLLDSNIIRSLLDNTTNSLIGEINILKEVSSTNDYLLNLNHTKKISIVLAEQQHQGKGRNGKNWDSPKNKNIYMSIKFQTNHVNNIHYIPLATAIGICKYINAKYKIKTMIKWPNDIYLDAKKLGGILVESRYNKESGYSIVVGIGLNVNMKHSKNIDQKWISIQNKLKQDLDRNILVSGLLTELLYLYNRLDKFDKNDFHLEWKQYDFLYAKEIKIIENTIEYSAVACGIYQDGSLIIKNDVNSHSYKRLYCADVSVKTKDG